MEAAPRPLGRIPRLCSFSVRPSPPSSCSNIIPPSSSSCAPLAYLASAEPALQATILHLPGTVIVSLLFSSLKVGFWRMKVQTCSAAQGGGQYEQAKGGAHDATAERASWETHLVAEAVGREMSLDGRLGLELTSESLRSRFVEL